MKPVVSPLNGFERMEALYIQFLQGVLLKYQHIPLLDVVGRRLSFKFQMYPWLHVTLQKNDPNAHTLLKKKAAFTGIWLVLGISRYPEF